MVVVAVRKLDTLCHNRHNRSVPDFDDLRVFEKVGLLRSFAAAAKALSLPRSNVSRSIARLEASLGTRLIQRTTREVMLTPAGESLMIRSATALSQLGEALDYIGGLSTEAHGQLRVSSGIGFGINVLSEQLPTFLASYPAIDLQLDLTSRTADLIADRVDIAIRFGPLPDSSMVAVRLGEMKRVLCASPSYIAREGVPATPSDIVKFDAIDMPDADGRARTWQLLQGGRTREIPIHARAIVNDALTIHRMTLNGTGIAIVACYLSAPDIAAGRLVQLLPEWDVPPIAVHMIFPSKRELAPVVRAFVEFMKGANPPGMHWQDNAMPTKA
jgi:LysR family transcriptional regulator, regulator for bpeEF and oprC